MKVEESMNRGREQKEGQRDLGVKGKEIKESRAQRKKKSKNRGVKGKQSKRKAIKESRGEEIAREENDG
jgi:hypothetical protein